MSYNFPKKLWEGRIPACFVLANHEVLSNKQAEPFYVMLPRSSYLTLFTKSILENFHDFINLDNVDEVWYEYKEKALRWHYPCGLLYDMHCDPSGSDLPWCITVHFQNFPQKELIRCPGEEAVESHFMTMLKEADQLKHKGQVISDMNKNQHQQLWHGLKMDNFEEFWFINKKFMDPFEDLITFKHIPIRIYYNGRIVQKLVAPKYESGDSFSSYLTLQEILQISFPSLFENNCLKEASMKIIIQGVTPPLNTTLQWLSEHMSYADNFLHVCIKAP